MKKGQESPSPLQQALVEDKHQAKERAGGLKAFLNRQGIELSLERYLIDAFGAMALGLFASLLIGTIINTVAGLFPDTGQVQAVLLEVGKFAVSSTGAAMAIAIGHSLKAPPLVLFSLAGVGLAANQIAGAGGPLAVFVIALIAAELGKLVSKTTPVDILVTPLVTVFSGVGLALWLAPGIGQAANAVGSAIVWTTEIQPFLMGILVSVLMGITLTLPISSAAIAAAFGLTGLAGGAALAGCSAQMVGFAIMSYRANGPGGLIAQGLGTSMLQMSNIMKKPIIWLPPILVSAITGPISTLVFKLEMNGPPISSGMGTSGLVGPIGMISGWFEPSEAALAHGAELAQAGLVEYLGLGLICLVLPLVLTPLIALPLRKAGWFSDQDLQLNLG